MLLLSVMLLVVVAVVPAIVVKGGEDTTMLVRFGVAAAEDAARSRAESIVAVGRHNAPRCTGACASSLSRLLLSFENTARSKSKILIVRGPELS